MQKKTTHVIPNPQGGWDVKKGGATRSTKHFDLKKEAVGRARDICKNQKSELYIHNKDGRIACKDSHGYDPCPPKDKK